MIARVLGVALSLLAGMVLAYACVRLMSALPSLGPVHFVGDRESAQVCRSAADVRHNLMRGSVAAMVGPLCARH